MRNLDRVFPSEEIYRRVWGEEAWSSENTVMVHIVGVSKILLEAVLNPLPPAGGGEGRAEVQRPRTG